MHSLKAIVILCVLAAILSGCTPVEPISGDARFDVSLPPVDSEGAMLGAIEKDYSNPDLHFRLGRVYQASNRISMAQFQYEQALTIDPMHFDSQAAMIRMWKNAGDSAKEATETDRYIGRARTAGNLINLGMALHRQELYEQARRCYERAAQLQPDNPLAYKGMGLYYLHAGDKDNAARMFAKSFELNPYQEDVAMELGRLGIAVKSRVSPVSSPEKPSQSN